LLGESSAINGADAETAMKEGKAAGESPAMT
jgi:hypothetical protein